MRGKQAPKREAQPDPRYNSTRMGKFINYIMLNGKKNTAQDIVYKALDMVEEKTGETGLEMFEKAVRNITPQVEVKARRIGGANYQVPVEVKGARRFALASRWLINASRARKGKPMYQRLALEIMDAAEEQGEAFKKKQDVHRMAEANRAFAHFA